MKNRYLDGENITPRTNKDAKKLIGKTVRYLRSSDIDRSGRGYFFPRRGLIEEVYGKNIKIDGDFISFSSLVEIEDIQCLPTE